MQASESKYMPNMTIYVAEDQRAEMDWLLQELDRAGVDVRDNRGNLSYSKMIRHLVSNEAMTQRVRAEKGRE